MSRGSRALRVLVCGMALGVGLTGCRGDGGLSTARRALEGAGFRSVAVAVRTGGGIDVVRVDAVAPAGSGPDQAAEVVWRALPVRFDQLVVSVTAPAPATAYSYERLAGRFGARDPALDRRQAGDAVVHSGLELVVILSLGAVLAGAGVAAGTVLILRGMRRSGASGPPPRRRRRRQADGPISGLGSGSPTAAGSAAADDADAMPS